MQAGSPFLPQLLVPASLCKNDLVHTCSHPCPPTQGCVNLQLHSRKCVLGRTHQGTWPVPWESAHNAGERRTSTKPSQGGLTARGYCVRGPGFLPRVWYPAGPASVGMRGVTTEGRWRSGIQGLLVWPTRSPCPPATSRGTQLLSMLWKSMKRSSYRSHVPISAAFAESSSSPVWPPLPFIPQP